MLSFGDNISDTACKLECVENLPPVHEFVGPVRIVLMDVPKTVYTKKVWMSAAIGFAEMLIGATVMTILFYTLGFKTPIMMNLHIVLCTIGYQLLIPASILMISNLHGPSAPLKQPDRKFQHLFLQIVGLACAAAGSVLVILLAPGSLKDKFSSIHCLTGLVAGGLSVVATVNGPAAYFAKEFSTFAKVARRSHIVFGVPAFIASSLCFCLGVYSSKSLKSWVPVSDMVYILILFCFIYTLIIIITPIMRLFE